MLMFHWAGYIICFYEMVFRWVLDSGLDFFEPLAVVASPIVAIVAIVLGNRHARERDKENMSKQLQFSHLNELLDRLCILEFKAQETGLAFLNYIIAVHQEVDDKTERSYIEFVQKQTDLQMYGNTVCIFGDVVLSIMSNDSTFEEMRNAVTHYAHVLSNDIIDYHDSLANTRRYHPDTVLDMTQEKLKEEDYKLQEILASYIGLVSKLIRELSM